MYVYSATCWFHVTSTKSPQGQVHIVACNSLWDESLVGLTQGIAATLGLSVNEVNFCIMYSLFNLIASIGFYFYDTWIRQKSTVQKSVALDAICKHTKKPQNKVLSCDAHWMLYNWKARVLCLFSNQCLGKWRNFKLYNRLSSVESQMITSVMWETSEALCLCAISALSEDICSCPSAGDIKGPGQITRHGWRGAEDRTELELGACWRRHMREVSLPRGQGPTSPWLFWEPFNQPTPSTGLLESAVIST